MAICLPTDRARPYFLGHRPYIGPKVCVGVFSKESQAPSKPLEVVQQAGASFSCVPTCTRGWSEPVFGHMLKAFRPQVAVWRGVEWRQLKALEAFVFRRHLLRFETPKVGGWLRVGAVC